MNALFLSSQDMQSRLLLVSWSSLWNVFDTTVAFWLNYFPMLGERASEAQGPQSRRRIGCSFLRVLSDSIGWLQ